MLSYISVPSVAYNVAGIMQPVFNWGKKFQLI